tara:strand:- start:2705 stop:3595 length:891 start_codon:yes stop_codon:yes gene_type:complete
MNEKNNYILLNNHKENIYSQSGEDGILKKILENIHIKKSNEFVEFGAHDGKTNSNCFNLLENYNYFGLFIEPDKKRFNELNQNTKSMNCKNINSSISIEGNSTLDNILTQNNISKNFDILSIDIDGYDYQVFESLMSFNPKIVIIEYNPTIPNDIEYIQPDNFKRRHGSSAKSIIILGKNKGYTPIAITDTNIFMLKEEIFDKSNFIELDLNESREDKDVKINVFYGYNGDLIYSKDELSFRWHFLKFKSNKLQPIPRYLRELLEDYSLFKNFVYKLFKLYLKIISKIRNFINRIS